MRASMTFILVLWQSRMDSQWAATNTLKSSVCGIEDRQSSTLV